MEVRVVTAGRGWQWLLDGFALFRKAAAMWIAITVVLAVIWLVSFVMPLLGPLLFQLLAPVLFAGLMLGCRALDNGEPLELRHLFAGFGQQAAALVTIGGVYLVGTIAVMMLIFVVAGGSMLPMALSGGAAPDLETAMAAARSLLLGVSIGALVYLVLIMFIWFAPVLIVFDGIAPVAAMKLSFSACVRNTMPFLVYGLVLLLMWIVTSVPPALGVVSLMPGLTLPISPVTAALGFIVGTALLIVSIPVLFCSIYASYRDIFQAPPAPTTPAGNPFLR